MRKLHFIAVLSLALCAAPYLSAQQQKLPAHFAGWSGQPSAMWVETEAASNYLDLWKETGRTAGEFCEYSSGDAKIQINLQKYRDPSSAYEMYTALIRPEMHPSTLNRTSAVDGDRLFALVGSSILEVRPAPAISTADLVTLVNAVSAHADQTPLPPGLVGRRRCLRLHSNYSDRGIHGTSHNRGTSSSRASTDGHYDDFQTRLILQHLQGYRSNTRNQ